MDSEKIQKLKQYIDQSQKIVFFGGAGVSTESGVPDFRSKDGLYNQHDIRFDAYEPEYLLSHSCLQYEPEVFFEFYRQKMDARFAQPNAAHKYLAKLEQQNKLLAVVTQNIDGLHQKAGSKRVYEIHGTTKRNYCTKCHREYPADAIYESTEAVPHCSCDGIIRCDVTLYEEALPELAVEKAVWAISNADLLIIGGTSLTVYPAASFIRYFNGPHLVVINRSSIGCIRDPENDLEINENIGKVFQTIDENGTL